MTRKKVKLVWIVNDAARKASLKKRRVGLLKKVSELTTLCGVSAFAVIYSPDEAEPMIWPSRSVVEEMLERYQNMAEMERCKKMMNQETYLKERMGKIHEQARKNQKKNREIEMSYLMDRLHYHGNGINDFEVRDMQLLVWLLEERMREIRKRAEYFQQVPPLLPPGHRDFPPPPRHLEEMNLVGGGSGGGGDQIRNNNPTDAMMWDQWFLDMVNNNENNAANNMASMIPPYAYNFPPGFHGGEVDMGGAALGLGLPLFYPYGNFTIGTSTGDGGLGNPTFNMGLASPMGGNHPPFGLSNPHHIVGGGSNSGEHAMELGLHPQHNHGGGSTGNDHLWMPGFFAGGTDHMGLPYDPTKGWPHNFSP